MERKMDGMVDVTIDNHAPNHQRKTLMQIINYTNDANGIVRVCAQLNITLHKNCPRIKSKTNNVITKWENGESRRKNDRISQCDEESDVGYSEKLIKITVYARCVCVTFFSYMYVYAVHNVHNIRISVCFFAVVVLLGQQHHRLVV